ncbi:hypothetical protein BD560DRAFT_394248 [Blakeslea trispora]|nr:hypothetical protein BD560DRAFT_394248 [Blakeslea trispora]
MIHPFLVSHQADLQIVLEQDHVTLYGSPEESAGVMLKGHVVLNCFAQTKVKSIKLKFTGLTQVNWMEALDHKSKQHKADHVLIEKEWTFIEFKKKVHCFQPGHYAWEFQLPLPGHLPISVHHNLGKIKYQFSASCDRPTFSQNYVAHRTIQLCRILSLTDLMESVIISDRWAGKINYHISIPSKWYSPDMHIPVSIHLEPLAYQLTVKSVCLTLKEYITGHVSGHQKTKGKKLSRMRDDRHGSTHGHWVKTLQLIVPVHLNFDMQSDFIQVRHKVNLTIALANFDGHISASIPVMITPLVEDGHLLPAYEETGWSPITCVFESDIPPTYESAMTA